MKQLTSEPRLLRRALFALALCAAVAPAAQATLTVAPITWNVIGLDSNSPAAGPRHFPVGARVCTDVATTNVAVSFVWDSANANVNLRPGTAGVVNFSAIGAGSCADAYFEVEVTPVPAAYDTVRRYHVTATDSSGTFSTPTPRELYVEHLISQNRNSVTDVKLNGVSIPAGGSMALLVGNTYTIDLVGGTATQGYEQFEEFINFPNTIFRINSVSTLYAADSSGYVSNPNDKLYGDGCLWQNDPNAPTYRSCVGVDPLTGKIGGAPVTTTYNLTIIGGGGTNQTLSTLLYDFSGSSFHYNSDFSTGARIAAIIDPTLSGISKSFTPSTTSVNGVSKLTITLTNPSGASIGGYNFTDPLPAVPAGFVVANPPAATTSSCGSPTFAPTAGATSLTFLNGTVAANGTCTISVNVTASVAAGYTNTTNHLFIGTIDTGNFGQATLTVSSAPPPPACTAGLEAARWTMEPAQGTGVPPAPSFQAANVATANAAYTGTGTNAVDATQGNPINSWSATGWAPDATGFPNATTQPFIDFTLDTSRFTTLGISSDHYIATGNWAAPANNFLYIYTTANGAPFAAGTPTIVNWNLPKGSWNTIPAAPVNATATGSSTTTFRMNAVGAKTLTDPMYVDNVIFTGCGIPVAPTLTKAFSPNPIAVGATSTLTFAFTNAANVVLTGVSFTDALPPGLQVAAVPAASTTCGGGPTWAPAAPDTTLTFGSPTGATIPARVGAVNGTCTAQVNVTATTAGPHLNVSGYVTSTQTGPNVTGGGSGSASLTAVLPPVIDKLFAPNPILQNGISTLTFTISNPNLNDALAGVGFSDTYPGGVVTAAVPGVTNSCGGGVTTGVNSVSLTGGALAGGASCTVAVDITAAVVGSYANTSGNVSHVINSVTLNGNTASDTLVVEAPKPSISLLKQVGPSATGPWTSFLAVAAGANVYYRFTVENTGDVPLSPVSLTDGTVDVSACNAAWGGAFTLPVAVAGNENHIATCVVGPVTATAGSHTNTAHATGTYSGTPYDSANETATYATTGLTLDKTSPTASYTNPGDLIAYSYLVTNSGSAPLLGPVTLTDDKATVSCAAVNTVGDLDDYLDPGESVTCTATYTVVPGDIGTSVTNTATAHLSSVDSNVDQVTVGWVVPVQLYRFEVE